MSELVIKNGKVTSLDLVKEINMFRAEIEGKSEVAHNDLLKVIRDEFEEEIGMGEISHTPYIHPQNGQEYPMKEVL
jgi:NifB/MoaA-like Fe-S oxidoreductase